MPFLKSAEHAAKKIFVIILKLFIRLPKVDHVDPAKIKSILFLRHDWLGDVIISTPVFRLVKQAYPAMQIGVLTTPSGGRLIEHDPHLTTLHRFNKKKLFAMINLIRTIRSMRYDAVVNLVYRTSFTGSLLAFICAPKHALRIRLTGEDDKDFFYTLNITKKIFGAATKTMVEETAEILPAMGIGLAEADLQPRIYIPPKILEFTESFFKEQGSGASIKIGINLSAREQYREWSVDKIQEFVEKISRENSLIALYIFGAPGSEKYTQLKAVIKNPRSIFVPQNPDILAIAAILQRMQMLISPDTAMVHLASALNVPTLGLYYNSEKSILWRPFGVPFKTIISPSGNIADINANEVLINANALLKQIKVI